MNHRKTSIQSSTKDEVTATKLTKQLRNMQNPTLHYILCKHIECNTLHQKPQYLQILFTSNLPLITQMIQWMLTPKQISKKKNIKSNMDFFPYHSKQFMKDNIYFYQYLYLFAKNNKLPLNIWFNFIKKQFYDPDTIVTALGYFAQVMIPFAKYQFSQSVNLNQSIDDNKDDNYYTFSIMKILPKQLIDQLIQYCHYQPIYHFLKTSILVCIEDPIDYKLSKQTMLKILQHAQFLHIFSNFPIKNIQPNTQLQSKIDYLQNVSVSLKQVIQNFQPNHSDLQLRTQSLISAILQSKIILYAITQLTSTKYCNPQKSKPPQLSTAISNISLSSSQSSMSSSQQILSKSLSAITPQKNPIKTPPYFLQNQQEDLLEILLKIINYSVQIFNKIPKDYFQFTSQINQTSINHNQYSKYISYHFKKQMQFLLDNLQKLICLIFNQQLFNLPTSKPLSFSSGQKIKPITFMKYQCLKLIYHCLIMTQCKDNTTQQSKTLKNKIIQPLFQFKIQKLHIIQIIQKYLSQNRWNNVVHHILQKICHTIIIYNYKYINKNIEKQNHKKITENFLSFLIENFTQKDYIFLNTFKFTSQGNLQSLYNISKDLAYTLNSTNQLAILLTQFQPWKKFILNDLKLYQQKTYPKTIQPKPQQLQSIASSDVLGLKVDEADSIRKLIQHISSIQKWPKKITKTKFNTKSTIIPHSNDANLYSQTQHLSKSTGHYFRKNDSLPNTLQDLLNSKIHTFMQQQIKKQIKTVEVQDIKILSDDQQQLHYSSSFPQSPQKNYQHNINSNNQINQKIN